VKRKKLLPSHPQRKGVREKRKEEEDKEMKRRKLALRNSKKDLAD
jgi:hypothetical protein